LSGMKKREENKMAIKERHRRRIQGETGSPGGESSGGVLERPRVKKEEKKKAS